MIYLFRLYFVLLPCNAHRISRYYNHGHQTSTCKKVVMTRKCYFFNVVSHKDIDLKELGPLHVFLARTMMRTSIARIRPYLHGHTYLVYSSTKDPCFPREIYELYIWNKHYCTRVLCVLIWRGTCMDKGKETEYKEYMADQKSWLGTKPRLFPSLLQQYHITFDP